MKSDHQHTKLFSRSEWSEISHLLAEVGRSVRKAVRGDEALRGSQKVMGFAGGDTIFKIDKIAEEELLEAFSKWPERYKPIQLYGEGLDEDGSIVGDRRCRPRIAILIDPIDGTRNIMYDKRSAWFIAAAAAWQEKRPTTDDIRASVLVELPPSKAGLSDIFVLASDGPLIAERTPLAGGGGKRWIPRPSGSKDLEFGFAQVANFFPGTKVLASELMEFIAANVSGSARVGESLIFDDQYLSTAGQFVELLCGHDRFCCDLRPLFHRILAQRDTSFQHGLECHPYDIAGLKIAEAAGVILTDGFGNKLTAPFDCNTGIHWCGYANVEIQKLVQPVVQRWLDENLL